MEPSISPKLVETLSVNQPLPFKLSVLGDPHLTNNLPHTLLSSSFRVDRMKDYLEKFFKISKKEKSEFLIVPGDLCHRTLLDSKDLDLLVFFLELVRKSKIKTIISLGNHDLDNKESVLSFLNNYSKSHKNLFYNEEECWEVETDGAAKILIRVINHCSDNRFLVFSGVATREKKYDYKILVGHVGIKGTLHGSMKSIVGINKEDIEKVSTNYDLMIFGHHHLRQTVTKNGFYAGSIHQTRIDEAGTTPGGLILLIPERKVRIIPNNLSPKFRIISDYTIVPESIHNSIVKLVLDLENKTEEENLEFLEQVRACDPYFLIKPKLKKAFVTALSVGKVYKGNKEKALRLIMRKTVLPEEKREEFSKFTLDLFEQAKRERILSYDDYKRD